MRLATFYVYHEGIDNPDDPDAHRDFDLFELTEVGEPGKYELCDWYHNHATVGKFDHFPTHQEVKAAVEKYDERATK